ncbi:acyltransferase domain-containing protein [Streptomyces sp. S3(2020)]|nr:acyltransferase domain-containing protein [Streptomyces sp. S3(2020)]
MLLPLSARTPSALVAYARAFRDELVRRPDLDPADLLTTTALGRRHLPHRLVVTAPFVEGLDAFLAGAPGALTGTADRTVAPAFLFSGQGTGGPGMAAALAARFPVVAEVLRECARVYEEETGEHDFLERITGGPGMPGVHEDRAGRDSEGAHAVNGPNTTDRPGTPGEAGHDSPAGQPAERDSGRAHATSAPSITDRPATPGRADHDGQPASQDSDRTRATNGPNTTDRPATPGEARHGSPADRGVGEAHRPARHGPVVADPRRLDRPLGPESGVAWDTAFAQPAIFALQVAQTRLWRSWGVRPGAVAGHSVGEFAALCAAGALSVADGMRLLCRRGRLMQGTAPGAMLAVFADRDRVRRLVAEVGRVELAVSNGPEHQVLAGPPDAVDEAYRLLTEQGLTGVPLPVDRAFHSALLDPVLDELRTAAERTELRPVEIEFVSGLDGVAHPPGWLPDADHLVRQARRPADFHAVLRTLGATDALLELGPDATLTRLARRAVPDTLCVPTGGTPDDVWRAAARLHCAGAPLDWAALLEGCGGRRIPLPTYPFEHRPYWIGPPPPPTTAAPALEPAHGPAREPDGENDVTDQAVLKRVRELTAQHLGYDQDGLRAGQTYVGLGADSLQLIGMLRQLEGEFGVRLAVRELLEDAGSPELTARLIAERVARPAPEPRAEIIDVRQIPERQDTAPSEAPGPDAYASRAEVAELRRQIDVLAETQASLITQLSDAVALLTAERAAR